MSELPPAPWRAEYDADDDKWEILDAQFDEYAVVAECYGPDVAAAIVSLPEFIKAAESVCYWQMHVQERDSGMGGAIYDAISRLNSVLSQIKERQVALRQFEERSDDEPAEQRASA